VDQQQTEQFHTGVSTGSDDGDFNAFHGGVKIPKNFPLANAGFA
jgi:hypothetical protein